MTAEHDLERTLDLWFRTEAGPPPPSEPLVHILETTRGRRPRPALVARIGSAWVMDPETDRVRGRATTLRPGLVIAIVTLLVLALAGSALLVGSRLLEVRRPDTSNGEFTPAADLPTPMVSPALVGLADGRVLVFDSDTNSAIVYDPTSGDSVPAGPMVSADSPDVSVAVRLDDGRVLVLGNAVAEIFDPRTMQFTEVGPMATPRVLASATLLHDGRVLVAGGIPPTPGYHDGLTSAELFDPQTLAFSATGSMSTSREIMATLPDGRVFAIGGDCCGAEVYDPATGTPSAAGVIPEGALSGCCEPVAAIVGHDGRVIIVGSTAGQTRGYAAIWDPASRTFTAAYRLSQPVFDAILLDDGRILLTGGRPASWAGIHDPTTGETVSIEPPTAWRPSSTKLVDGSVVIAGGLVDGELRPDPSGSVGLDAPAVPTVEIFR